MFKEKHSFSLYKAREKSLKKPTVVYDIINTYLYSIVYTYIVCVCMYIFCRIFIIFCGPAIFRNENSFTVQVSAPPNLRKDIYTRKGLNTPPQPKDSIQILCFTIDQRITITGILEF